MSVIEMRKKFIQNNIKEHGNDFSVYRGGEQVGTVRGCHFRNESPEYIGILPGSDVSAHDVLTDITGRKYYVTGVEPDLNQNVVSHLMVYYETEMERSGVMKPESPTNIYIQGDGNNVYGGNAKVYGNNAVAENQGVVNYAPDNSTVNELRELLASHMDEYKEDIDRLLSIVQEIENGTIIVKKGVFSTVKAIIALIPGVGPFLKRKYPAAFDGDAP